MRRNRRKSGSPFPLALDWLLDWLAAFLTKRVICATLQTMRVLHLVHQYLPEHVGGVELYTQSTAAALTRRGHAVAICYRQDRPGGGWEVRQEGAVQNYALWDGARTPAQRFAASFGAPRLLASIAAALDHFRPDLVHVQHLMGLPLAVRRLLATRRLPYLLTLHDYWWVCVNANLRTNYDQSNCAGPQQHVNCTRCVLARGGARGTWPLAPALWGGLVWRGRQARRWLTGARLLLAPSAYVRAWYLGQGAPADRLHVLRLGVTAAATQPPRAPGGRPAGVRFLYLGSIAPIKGVHVAVEALRGVTGPAELWLAGDPAVDPAYTAQLQQLADGRVRFLGRLARSDVWATLAQCDVLVAPSLVPETFCMASYEASASGVPVLAARIGALAESVTDGQTGQLLPPGDVAQWRAAFQRLADDPAQVSAWRANLRQPLTVDEHVDQLIAYYEKALQL